MLGGNIPKRDFTVYQGYGKKPIREGPCFENCWVIQTLCLNNIQSWNHWKAITCKMDARRSCAIAIDLMVKILTLGTLGLKGKIDNRFRRGSNPWPFACKANVITTTLRNQVCTVPFVYNLKHSFLCWTCLKSESATASSLISVAATTPNQSMNNQSRWMLHPTSPSNHRWTDQSQGSNHDHTYIVSGLGCYINVECIDSLL